MELCVATTANDLEQAEAIKDVLESAGVNSTLHGALQDAYPGTPSLGAIEVLVSDQDLAVARDVLARAADADLDFDLDEEA
jgi:hypothetical protein